MRPSREIWSWVPRLWPMYASRRRLLHVTRSKLACRCRPPVDGGHPVLLPEQPPFISGSHLSGGGTIIEISSGRKKTLPNFTLPNFIYEAAE